MARSSPVINKRPRLATFPQISPTVRITVTGRGIDYLKCVKFAGAGYTLRPWSLPGGPGMSEQKKEKDLGMGCAITRRDFLNGVAVSIGGTLVGGGFSAETLLAAAAFDEFAPEKEPGYYPPARLGMRGNHDGTFTFAHRLREIAWLFLDRKSTRLNSS